MKKLALTLVAISLVGCGKFGIPRTIVSVGRSAVAFADQTFNAVQDQLKKACIQLIKTEVTECVAKLDKAKADYEKAKTNALSSLDTTEKIIDALAKSDSKDFLSWLPVAQSAVCTIDSILSWLPDKAQQHIVVKTLRGLKAWAGCK